MKRLAAIGTVLVPLLASGGMNITTNERVSAMLKPDVLRGDLRFEEQGKNANAIKEHLGAIVAEVKRIDPKGEYCRGGGYNLSPRYSYKDQKQEFVGYSGTLYFTCELASIDQYDEVSAAIDKVSAPSVRKNQGALTWGVSDALEREMQNRLRLEMLRKAAVQAASFSKETKMVCEVAAINFGGTPHFVPRMEKGIAMMASVPTESPIQSDEESVLEASVDYNCSNRVP